MVQKKRANQQQADRHYNRNTGKMKSLVPRRNRIEIQKDRKTRSKISRKLLLSFSVWIMHWIMEERKKWTESEANKTKRKQKWTIFLFFLCISTKAQAATRWSECFAHLLNNFFLSFFLCCWVNYYAMNKIQAKRLRCSIWARKRVGGKPHTTMHDTPHNKIQSMQNLLHYTFNKIEIPRVRDGKKHRPLNRHWTSFFHAHTHSPNPAKCAHSFG